MAEIPFAPNQWKKIIKSCLPQEGLPSIVLWGVLTNKNILQNYKSDDEVHKGKMDSFNNLGQF